MMQYEKSEMSGNKNLPMLQLQCKHCESNCANWHDLKTHLEIDHNQNYPCNLCQDDYKNICNLKDHLRIRHNKKKDMIQ